MSNVHKYGLLAVKALLTLAFVAAGAAKLIGAEMMVATFEAIGWGQWFRYVTGVIEVGAAILLWVPGRQAIGAFLLTATMIAAVGFHLLVLGPSAVPAAVLGLLSALVLYAHRGQLRGAVPA
ncbi:DoxX family protein [Hasllibacter sp. MH4015]|uniref:DoxX family protein n=1 Tax=Hasllibacter sp. MH4015 TaxID=2854029 RepID=UPI001CD646B9|nr:DoxX family protein [Hasllibacter sp. MH4015]